MESEIPTTNVHIQIFLSHFKRILNIFKEYSPKANLWISPNKISLFSKLNQISVFADLKTITIKGYDQEDPETQISEFEEFSVYINIITILKKITSFNKNATVLLKIIPDKKNLIIENVNSITLSQKDYQIISTNTIITTTIEFKNLMIFNTECFNPEFCVSKTYIYLNNFLGFLKSIESNKCIKCDITPKAFYFSSIGEEAPTQNWMDSFDNENFPFSNVICKLNKERLIKLKALKVERVLCQLISKDNKALGLYFEPSYSAKLNHKSDILKIFFEFEQPCQISF